MRETLAVVHQMRHIFVLIDTVRKMHRTKKIDFDLMYFLHKINMNRLYIYISFCPSSKPPPPPRGRFQKIIKEMIHFKHEDFYIAPFFYSLTM